jgi:hypothetical protein
MPPPVPDDEPVFVGAPEPEQDAFEEEAPWRKGKKK